jgi:hypothetical protein
MIFLFCYFNMKKIFYIIIFLIILIYYLRQKNKEHLTANNFYITPTSNIRYYTLTNTESNAYFINTSDTNDTSNNQIIKITNSIALFQNKINLTYFGANLKFQNNVFFAIPIPSIINTSTDGFILEMVFEYQSNTTYGNILSIMKGPNPYTDTYWGIQVDKYGDDDYIMIKNQNLAIFPSNTNIQKIHILMRYKDGKLGIQIVSESGDCVGMIDMDFRTPWYMPTSNLYIGLNTPHIYNPYKQKFDERQFNGTIHYLEISKYDLNNEIIKNTMENSCELENIKNIPYTDAYLTFLNISNISIKQDCPIVEPQIITQEVIKEIEKVVKQECPIVVPQIITQEVEKVVKQECPIVEPRVITQIITQEVVKEIEKEVVKEVKQECPIVEPQIIEREKIITQEVVQEVKQECPIVEPQIIEREKIITQEVIKEVYKKEVKQECPSVNASQNIQPPIKAGSNIAVNNDNNNDNDNNMYIYIIIGIIILIIVIVSIIIVRKNKN